MCAFTHSQCAICTVAKVQYVRTTEAKVWELCTAVTTLPPRRRRRRRDSLLLSLPFINIIKGVISPLFSDLNRERERWTSGSRSLVVKRRRVLTNAKSQNNTCSVSPSLGLLPALLTSEQISDSQKKKNCWFFFSVGPCHMQNQIIPKKWWVDDEATGNRVETKKVRVTA